MSLRLGNELGYGFSHVVILYQSHEITCKSHGVPCFQELPSTLQVNRIHNPQRGGAGAPLTPRLMLGCCQPETMSVTEPESKYKHDPVAQIPGASTPN